MPKKKKGKGVICSFCCEQINDDKDYAGCRARRCPMQAGRNLYKIENGVCKSRPMSDWFRPRPGQE